MQLSVDEYKLDGLAEINVIVGKNGCGKSSLLKEFEGRLNLNNPGIKRYVTPERGGVLSYEAGIEQNMTGDVNWLTHTRRKNQFRQFREQTMVQFRRLELAIHREAEDRSEPGDFSSYLTLLNTLLDNVEMRRGDPVFSVVSRATDTVISPENLSSGESELIALGIEALLFAKEAEPGKENLFFLDEPDVHLHPDLQARLVKFLISLVQEQPFTIVMATHSTAILGALSHFDGAKVAFMKVGDQHLNFRGLSESLDRVLPVFGAHPLSNVFNERPILIVEGEDDERVWQQAVRSSEGRIAIYPVSCDSVSNMSDYEQEVQQIVSSVYDAPRAYSLRDRDDGPEMIDDLPPVTRMRLSCRTIENLILSDDVLASTGITWDEARSKMDGWIERNPDHVRFDDMVAFRDGGYERKTATLKQIRLILVDAILGSTKSWEVLVGKVIAAVSRPADNVTPPEHSLPAYLGEKATRLLLAPAAN